MMVEVCFFFFFSSVFVFNPMCTVTNLLGFFSLTVTTNFQV